MELARQKVLVTGATGFIGSRVVARLLREKGAAVRALARDPARAQGLAKLGAEVVIGDLADFASLQRAVRDCSAVIHAAAQVSSVSSRDAFEQSNVRGTENIMRAAEAARVSRLIHLSSIAVFGLAALGEVTDESPRCPSDDPYCDTKLEAEEAALRAQRERRSPIVILRPSAVYGPGSTHWTVVPIKRIKKGKMFLFDGGSGFLNYVYIDNLVDAIFLACEDDRALGDAFIVNDGATTWREFFGAMARMAGKNSLRSVPLWAGKFWAHYRNFLAAIRGETFRIHPNALGFLASRAVYRQTRLEKELGYRPRVGLEEGLRRTEAWLREVGLL
ncbi:MAG: hypothetical protein DMG23_09540 [Acidobacteria bacterium]|nr:MAG: hypothetical protein DMG23_09540 [Acidobacteriota bacterium]